MCSDGLLDRVTADPSALPVGGPRDRQQVLKPLVVGGFPVLWEFGVVRDGRLAAVRVLPDWLWNRRLGGRLGRQQLPALRSLGIVRDGWLTAVRAVADRPRSRGRGSRRGGSRHLPFRDTSGPPVCQDLAFVLRGRHCGRGHSRTLRTRHCDVTASGLSQVNDRRDSNGRRGQAHQGFGHRARFRRVALRRLLARHRRPEGFADRSGTAVRVVPDGQLGGPRHQDVEVHGARQCQRRERGQHSDDAVREMQCGPSGLRTTVHRDGVQGVHPEARPGGRQEEEPDVRSRAERLVAKQQDRPHAVPDEAVDEDREQVAHGLARVDRDGDLPQRVEGEREAGRTEHDDRGTVPGRHPRLCARDMLTFGRRFYVRASHQRLPPSCGAMNCQAGVCDSSWPSCSREVTLRTCWLGQLMHDTRSVMDSVPPWSE